MRFIKKINLLLLFLCTIFSCSFLSVIINASDKKVENVGATYRVEKVVEQSDLGYGLTYSRSIAYSSTKEGHYVGSNAGSVGGSLVPNQEYQQQVNLIEMLKDSEAQFIPYANLKGGNWNTSTVRLAASEFESENPGMKVIAAVNGDWFSINDPVKAAVGVTISNGEYYKNHTIHGTVNTLVFDNELVTGQRIFQIGETAVKPMLAFYDEDGNIIKEVQINKVNSEPGNGEIALYFAKKTDEFQLTTVEQKVTNAYIIDRATKAVTTIQESFYGLGKITSFEKEFSLGFGNFAIKTNNSSIDDLLNVGVTIRCQFEYQNEQLGMVKNAIGFPYGVMKDGVAQYPADSGYHYDAKIRKPRTFLGVREDGSVIIATVDGRQPNTNMYGMNLMEMGALLEYYGCVNGWKLDGGGSSTMVIRKQSGFTVSASFKEEENNDWVVVNSPSDGNERFDGNCLLIAVKVPEIEFEIDDITDTYVTFNIVLLSDLDKYSALYVIINGEKYLVEDGKVTIQGIKTKQKYECFLYGERDGELYNLGERKIIIGAYAATTEISAEIDLIEKKGINYVQIYIRADNKQSIRSISVMINNQVYVAASFAIVIPCNTDSFDALNDLEIKVVLHTSDLLDDKVLVFKDYEKTINVSFVMGEINTSINEFIDGIFISE